MSAAIPEPDRARLAAILRASPLAARLLDGLPALGLPDAWLVAGAVAQTVWNDRFGFPPLHGIADADLVYHDPADLSEAAEAAAAARAAACLPGLPVRLDVKNQARVHLWYGARFGRPIAPHPSTAAAVATYPTTATSLAVRWREGALDMLAPFGLADLLAGIVRPNPVLVSETVYAAKTARWRALWPNLVILPWSA